MENYPDAILFNGELSSWQMPERFTNRDETVIEEISIIELRWSSLEDR
jgi:hypothetical protein